MPHKRPHHNNKGDRQVRTGTHLKPLEKLAAELGVQLKLKGDENEQTDVQRTHRS